MKELKRHGLPHFTATWIDDHIDERHAQEFLGHASLEMTQHYIHNGLKKDTLDGGHWTVDPVVASSSLVVLDEWYYSFVAHSNNTGGLPLGMGVFLRAFMPGDVCPRRLVFLRFRGKGCVA